MTSSPLTDAYDAIRDGYSVDRVIADPLLNEAFINECKRLGLHGSPASLNHSLLNLRKRGALNGRARSKRTHFANEDEFRFATEMAARFLERREGVSLDSLLCDPALAEEFDRLVADIAPGFSSLQYRWAALNLRKAKKFEPEVASRIAEERNLAFGDHFISDQCFTLEHIGEHVVIRRYVSRCVSARL